jgi:Icc-related predicted phosphoesterase
MPTLQIISDTHFEFQADHGKKFVEELPVAGDILVIAGDMCQVIDDTTTWPDAMTRLLERFQHVVYVLGNHEYFGSSFEEVGDFLPRYARGRENLHILVNRRKVICGVPFVGTTLWYGPEAGGMLSSEVHYISDSEVIHAMNILGRKFLDDEVQQGDIVVTHHLPAHGSIAPRFVGDPLNVFFMSDCEQIIMDRRPKLWLHGHTHDACDYMFGETRIVCNPLGYPRERGVMFNKTLTIDV